MTDPQASPKNNRVSQVNVLCSLFKASEAGESILMIYKQLLASWLSEGMSELKFHMHIKKKKNQDSFTREKKNVNMKNGVIWKRTGPLVTVSSLT